MQGEETDMEVIEDIHRKLHEGMPVNAEMLNYKNNGTPFWNELVMQPLVDGKGEALFTASFTLDVTERKKDESLLRLQEAIFSGINAGVDLTDLLRKIRTVVESFFPKRIRMFDSFQRAGSGGISGLRTQFLTNYWEIC